MVVKLELTGEVIDDDRPLASLELDENGMLGLQHKAVNTIIAQLVRAINAACVQVERVTNESDQVFESIQALEQHLSSFESRIRDSEDTCQEVRLQLGTMVSGPATTSPVDRPESRDDVANNQVRATLGALVEQISGLGDRVEAGERNRRQDIERLTGKFEHCDDILRRHQDFFDDELESRMTQAEDDRVTIKAEVEALRQTFEDSNNRKASKVELQELSARIDLIGEGQREDHQMLADARKQFVKLDGLTDLVNENKNRMQEMWRLFGQESQELREWASTGFNELRCAVRSKMEKTEAQSHVDELRQQVRELSPYLSQVMTRVETGLRYKAEASEVVKLQDGLETLERQSGRPKKLLLGTKCLACDRQVSSAGFTDQGIISLEKDRQQADLFHEVQRALVQESSPTGVPNDVLKYVAIQVGNPTKMRGASGMGMFEARDPSDPSPGSHALVRSDLSTGGLGSSPRRPHTHDSARPAAAHSSARSPPREVPPLVRIVPRKPQPPPRIAAGSYAAPPTPRDGQPRRSHTIRAALGAATLPQTQAAPKMQPGAGQVHQQPSATSGVRDAPEWDGSMSSDNDENRGEGRVHRYLDRPGSFSEDSRPTSVTSMR